VTKVRDVYYKQTYGQWLVVSIEGLILWLFIMVYPASRLPRSWRGSSHRERRTKFTDL
jgi:hypothetical protein